MSREGDGTPPDGPEGPVDFDPFDFDPFDFEFLLVRSGLIRSRVLSVPFPRNRISCSTSIKSRLSDLLDLFFEEEEEEEEETDPPESIETPLPESNAKSSEEQV